MTDTYSLWRQANPDASHLAAYQAGYEAARKWLPIETAPKDGTRVMLIAMGGLIGIGGWGFETRYSDYAWLMDSYSYWLTPTHWQPLPAPETKE